MEPTDDLSRVYALSPHEQLTYWTGAIAQNDVDLENAMRRLATSILLSPTLGRADFPREFEALRETTKAILRASPLPQELRTEGVTILGGAKIAHRNRVELVHDMWALREGPTPPSFVVAHALMGRGWPVDPGPSRTLADFEAAARQHIASITEVGMFSMRVSTFSNCRQIRRGSIERPIQGGAEERPGRGRRVLHGRFLRLRACRRRKEGCRRSRRIREPSI
jgi:hypothetical protein